MKKRIFVIAILCTLSILCFAQQPKLVFQYKASNIIDPYNLPAPIFGADEDQIPVLVCGKDNKLYIFFALTKDVYVINTNDYRIENHYEMNEDNLYNYYIPDDDGILMIGSVFISYMYYNGRNQFYINIIDYIPDVGSDRSWNQSAYYSEGILFVQSDDKKISSFIDPGFDFSENIKIFSNAQETNILLISNNSEYTKRNFHLIDESINYKSNIITFMSNDYLIKNKNIYFSSDGLSYSIYNDKFKKIRQGEIELNINEKMTTPIRIHPNGELYYITYNNLLLQYNLYKITL